MGVGGEARLAEGASDTEQNSDPLGIDGTVHDGIPGCSTTCAP
jgi:hypothetical protein